jgi:peptidoglycan-associated lipoprotein
VKKSKPLFGRFALLSLLAMALVGISCSKPAPRATPPMTTTTTAPPAPARPTVTLQASPTFIQKGESATLTWSSTNATSLNLTPGAGTVAPEGSSKITPTDSTTYTITATGPGGTADQSVRITVSAAAAPVETTPTESEDTAFLREVHDAFFDYNKSDLRQDAKDALSQTAQFLRQHPNVKVVIEGHCDERGTTEYNLGLGQKRADTVKDFVVSLGIPADRVSTTSFGKEKPFCNGHDEACWQQNRRGHFVKQ